MWRRTASGSEYQVLGVVLEFGESSNIRTGPCSRYASLATTICGHCDISDIWCHRTLLAHWPVALGWVGWTIVIHFSSEHQSMWFRDYRGSRTTLPGLSQVPHIELMRLLCYPPFIGYQSTIAWNIKYKLALITYIQGASYTASNPDQFVPAARATCFHTRSMHHLLPSSTLGPCTTCFHTRSMHPASTLDRFMYLILPHSINAPRFHARSIHVPHPSTLDQCTPLPHSIDSCTPSFHTRSIASTLDPCTTWFGMVDGKGTGSRCLHRQGADIEWRLTYIREQYCT